MFYMIAESDCDVKKSIIFFYLQILITMPGRLGQQSKEAELSAVCGARAACRRVAEAVPRVGHHRAHLRRGSGALWTRPGPQYHVEMPGSRHHRHIACFAHAL